MQQPKERFARVKVGVEKLFSVGPVSVGMDRLTRQRVLVVDLPTVGPFPIPIDDEDYLRLGRQILREAGTLYRFGEPEPEPESAPTATPSGIPDETP